MKIDIAGYEALKLLEKYYTNKEWPVKKFDIDNMCCMVDCGDGSSFVRWDIIDLAGERLIKINDFYDSVILLKILL